MWRRSRQHTVRRRIPLASTVASNICCGQRRGGTARRQAVSRSRRRSYVADGRIAHAHSSRTQCSIRAHATARWARWPTRRLHVRLVRRPLNLGRLRVRRCTIIRGGTIAQRYFLPSFATSSARRRTRNRLPPRIFNISSFLYPRLSNSCVRYG